LVSSLHDDAAVDEENGKPEIINFYNVNKCGVDVVDQMCANYSVQRKTRRWPMVVFFNLMNVACINAFVIFKEVQGLTNYKRNRFLKDLGFALIRPHLEQRSIQRQTKYEIKMKCLNLLGQAGEDDLVRHSPFGESLERNAKGKQADCKICKSVDKKSRHTRIKCSACKIYICKNHCYDICDNCVKR
jgi:hypothetical protein